MTFLALHRQPATRRVVQNACIGRAVRAAHVHHTQHTFLTLDGTHTHPDSSKFVRQLSSVLYSTVYDRHGEINTDRRIYSFEREGQRLANATCKV